MKRLAYIISSMLLCGLAAFGAAKLSLGFGFGPMIATMASIAAFVGNFFMIEPFEDVIRR
jgi:hypothetical protein